MSKTTVLFFGGFFILSALSATLINDDVSFSKPCFCFLGAPLCEWSMPGR